MREIRIERERTKAIIELAPDVDSADKAIVKFLGNVSTKEKIAFLRGMFDINIVRYDNDPLPDETIYKILLDGIVEAKWNC